MLVVSERYQPHPVDVAKRHRLQGAVFERLNVTAILVGHRQDSFRQACSRPSSISSGSSPKWPAISSQAVSNASTMTFRASGPYAAPLISTRVR